MCITWRIIQRGALTQSRIEAHKHRWSERAPWTVLAALVPRSRKNARSPCTPNYRASLCRRLSVLIVPCLGFIASRCSGHFVGAACVLRFLRYSGESSNNSTTIDTPATFSAQEKCRSGVRRSKNEKTDTFPRLRRKSPIPTNKVLAGFNQRRVGGGSNAQET